MNQAQKARRYAASFLLGIKENEVPRKWYIDSWEREDVKKKVDCWNKRKAKQDGLKKLKL